MPAVISSVLALLPIAAAAPNLRSPEGLYNTFKEVCVDTPDIVSARRAAAALPGSSRQAQGDRSPSDMVYDMPDGMIGIWGNQRATCFVTAVINTLADLEIVAARMSELCGRPLKVRTRRDGFRYADWHQGRQPYHFEAKPTPDGKYQVVISVGNKERIS